MTKSEKTLPPWLAKALAAAPPPPDGVTVEYLLITPDTWGRDSLPAAAIGKIRAAGGRVRKNLVHAYRFDKDCNAYIDEYGVVVFRSGWHDRIL